MAATPYLCYWLGGQQSVNTIAECIALNPESYVMQSATLANQASLQNIFSIPVSSDLLQMWELGFGLPILCYLTAWAYGSLINFMDWRKN